MNHKKGQEEFNKFLCDLAKMNLGDLLELFVEAKTGSYRDIDKLPLDYLIMVDELGELINIIYANKVIRSTSKLD